MENKINAEDLVKNQDIDASHWAAAFMQIFGSDLRQIDEGLMISWFANSIMVTHDKISNEKDAAVEQLKKENESLKLELKQKNENGCCIVEHGYRMSAEHEITKLKSDLEIVRQTLEGQRAINDRQYAEKELLKSKLKVAVKAIHDLFNKAKDGSHYESIARQALKEIGEVNG